MPEHTFTCYTMTPIWTGDVRGHSAEGLQVPGLMGSIRWNYELLLRSVNAHVCNPIGDTTFRTVNPDGSHNPLDHSGNCLLDPKHLDEARMLRPDQARSALYAAGLCDVCQLFGATNWRRRFRLLIDGDLRPGGPSRNVRSTITHPVPRKGRGSGTIDKPSTWYFGSSGKAQIGRLTLRIVPTALPDQSSLVLGLLQWMADWTALGARPQLGYGVVVAKERQNPQHLYQHLAALYSPPASTWNPYRASPSLQNSFFCRLNLSRPDNENHTVWADLKVELRNSLRRNKQLRHEIFGYVNKAEGAQGSKVKVSFAYDPQCPTIRVWGWIPHSTAQRDQILNDIWDVLDSLKKQDSKIIWREFASSRDTVRTHTDILPFVADLLEADYV